MNSVNIKNIIYSRHPDFLKGFPNPIKDFVFFLINKILYISEINDFLTKYNGKMGIPFIDEIFERIDFSYTLSKKDKDKIPSEGRLVIIANHPLGGLDGLVLLKLISEIRPNVKILVNDILLNIDNLNEYFLPIDLFSGKLQKENLCRWSYIRQKIVAYKLPLAYPEPGQVKVVVIDRTNRSAAELYKQSEKMMVSQR